MKATSEIKQGTIKNIDYVILTFDDGFEIKLDTITFYNIDIKQDSDSIIEIDNALIDIDIINRYLKNNITAIHIACEYMSFNDFEQMDDKLFIDIPCIMSINKIKIDGSINEMPKMYIELQGGIM